jgi:hypothetical protein
VYTFHAMSTSCVPSFIFFFKTSKYIFYDFTGEGTTQPWGKREKTDLWGYDGPEYCINKEDLSLRDLKNL